MTGYTRILIRDLRLMMDIGVYDAEQGVRQPVLVNITADTSPPADAPAGFYVCYDTLAQKVRALAAAGHINLVEEFAARIADIALATPGVEAVRVRVEKLAALSDAAAVGVEIHRAR